MATPLQVAKSQPIVSSRVFPDFLRRVLDWQGLVDSQRFVGIHSIWKPPAGGGPPVFPGRQCLDFNDALNAIDLAEQENRDVYFCVSLQSQRDPSGHVIRGLKASKRGKAHAVAIKTLFIDVDVGKKGGYQTRQEALEDLSRVLVAAQLPPPNAMVSSGSEGFHAYWIFDQSIAPVVWQPMAQAFVYILREHGLKADLQVSVNPACLLRVPGTHNYKTGTARTVQELGAGTADYPVAYMEQVLKPHYGKVPAKQSKKPIDPGQLAGIAGTVADPAFAKSTAGIDDLSATPQRTIEEVATGCPFLAQTLATGGAGLAEPLWKETINVALWVKHSQVVAHQLSHGHASYTVSGTDAKFQTQFHVKQVQGLGWPQCRTIHTAGAAECASCPRLKDGKSPINFVVPVTTTAPGPFGATPMALGILPPKPWADQKLPHPYAYAGDTGLIMRPVEGGGTRPLFDRLTFYDGQLVVLETGIEALRCNALVIGESAPRSVQIDNIALNDKRSLTTALGRQNVSVRGSQAMGLADFMPAWMTHLREVGARRADTPLFGWHGDGFVFNGEHHTPTGSVPTHISSPGLAAHFQPTGDRAKVDEVVKFILDRGDPTHLVFLCITFASPLFSLSGTDETGVIWMQSTETAVGKTTTLNCAQALQGIISERSLMKDTAHRVLTRISKARHLAAYIDDIRIDPKEMGDFIMQAASGQSKGRLASDSSEQPVHLYSSICGITSNRSVFSFLKTPPERMRVIELRAAPLPPGVDFNAASITSINLKTNYGHHMATYAKWLGANRKQAKTLVEYLMQQFTKAFNMQVEERYWVRTAACIFAGAVLAQQLGLLAITDAARDRLWNYLGETMQAQRIDRAEAKVDLTPDVVIELLAEFITHEAPMRYLAFRNNQVILNGIVGVRETPNVYRFDDRIRVRQKAFTAWMVKNEKADTREVIRVLKTLPVQHENVARLVTTPRSEWHLSDPKDEILQFDADKPPWNTRF